MKYNFYEDPGHGWLKVHKKELTGIEDKISAWSYMRGEYVYLEEDCDATLFIDMKNIDTSNFVHHHTDLSSKIRGYSSYKNYTEKEKSRINELKGLMETCKHWGKKPLNRIKNASLEDLEYWQSIYNF